MHLVLCSMLYLVTVGWNSGCPVIRIGVLALNYLVVGEARWHSDLGAICVSQVFLA